MKPTKLRNRNLAFAVVMAIVAGCSDPLRVPPDETAEVAASVSGNVREEYIVMFRGFELSNVRAAAQEIVRRHGGSLGFVYEHAIQGFSAALPPSALAAIRADPRVAYVGRDDIVTVESR